MALINTANFALSFGTNKRTFGDRLDDTVLSVKDFGAVGDGTTDDTAAIQLAFDTLFGEYGDIHGGDFDGAWLNKNLRFPPGDYKISYPLMLNGVHGARLLGAGSHQTRIFWDPLEPEVTDAETVGGTPTISYSSLIEARTVQYMNMEGITLDASGVQDIVYRLMSYPPVDPNGGTGGSFRDVHFTNGGSTGVLSSYGDYGGATLNSEQTYIKCRFTNCSGYGLRVIGQNSLNFSFISSYFANCGIGYSSPEGGGGTFFACRFHNNDLDFSSSQAMMSVIGCDSTSLNFASMGGALIGCRHFPPSTGVSLVQSAEVIPLNAGPPWIENGGIPYIVVIGNHFGPDTFFANHTGGDPPKPNRIHLLGNLLDNSPDCFDELHITVGIGEVTCREDGVLVDLP